MSEETTEVADVETEGTQAVAEVDEAVREKRVSDFFDQLESKPTEAEAEVDADAEPESEPEQEQEPEKAPEPVKVEGPSFRAKQWAKHAGLSDRAIATASSDEALDILVEEFTAKSREAEPEKQPEPAPTFKLELPEDEFPANDPIRKQLEAMNAFYANQIKEANGDILLLAKHVVEGKQFVEQAQTAQHQTVLGAFDKRLDGYESPVLGDQANRNPKVRAAIWDTYCELKEEHPNANDDDLIDKAAETFGQKPKKQIRNDAIREAAAKRLGGSPAKSLPQRQSTKDDRWNALMDRIEAENHK